MSALTGNAEVIINKANSHADRLNEKESFANMIYIYIKLLFPSVDGIITLFAKIVIINAKTVVKN